MWCSHPAGNIKTPFVGEHLNLLFCRCPSHNQMLRLLMTSLKVQMRENKRDETSCVSTPRYGVHRGAFTARKTSLILSLFMSDRQRSRRHLIRQRLELWVILRDHQLGLRPLLEMFHLYIRKKKLRNTKTIIVLNQSCTFFEEKKLPAITVITCNIMLCPVRYPTFLEIIMSSFFFVFFCDRFGFSCEGFFLSSSLSWYIWDCYYCSLYCQVLLLLCPAPADCAACSSRCRWCGSAAHI